MQRLAILGVISILLSCGCAHPKAGGLSQLDPYSLSAEDMDFALALASYSAGIVEEIDNGPANTNTVEFFLEAARRDPSNYMLARKTAISLLYMHRPKEAAELLETAVSVNPANYPILMDLATVYEIVGDPAHKMTTYERAITLSPSNHSAYIGLAQTLLVNGRLDKALQTLEQGAAQANPEIMADMALINGAALLKGGFPDKSIAWFEFTAKHSKSNGARLHLILAEMYEARNQRAKAIEHCELALRSDSTLPEAFVKMAILTSDTDFQAALRILDEGEKQFPMHDLIIVSIAYISRDDEQLVAAAELLTRIGKRASTPPSLEFYLRLGSVQDQIGDLKSAEETFRTGLKTYPDADEMLNYLAYMWAEKGLNLAEGEALAQRALQLDPDSAAYLDTLGWIYYMQGRNSDARTCILKALDDLPDDPTILDHFGDILAKEGKIDEAVKAWRKSYSFDPDNALLKEKLTKHDARPEDMGNN